MRIVSCFAGNLSILIGPLVVERSPGESCAEGGENKGVAFVETISEVPQGQRNRCAGRIAEFFDVDQDLFIRKTHALPGRCDNAQVGLMGNEIGDVVGRQLVALHDLYRYVGHVAYGIFEDGFTVLIDEVHVFVDGFVGCGMERTAGSLIEVVVTDAVYVKKGILKAERRVVGRFDQKGYGSIAEQRAGVAIGVVGDARHPFAAYEDRLFGASRLDERGYGIE